MSQRAVWRSVRWLILVGIILGLGACGGAPQQSGPSFVRLVDTAVAEDGSSHSFKARVGTEYRDCLRLARRQAERSTIEEVTLSGIAGPPDGELQFALAVNPAAITHAGSTRFQVVVDTARGPVQLYDQMIHFSPETIAEQQWQVERVDLSSALPASADIGTLTFTFSATTEFAGAQPPVDGAIGLWGTPVVHSRRASAAHNRPNVILISLDTLRADHLGSYGYDRETSPNIDAFAKTGVLFEQCYSPSSWTTPSHASAFTGLDPVVHRVNFGKRFRLDEDFKTLAEYFRGTGFLTCAYTEGVAVGGQLGFYQGFDSYSNGEGVLPLPPATAEKVFGRARTWLDEMGHHPFFLFVHTYEIHAPYQAPEPFGSRFAAPEEKTGPAPTAPARRRLPSAAIDKIDTRTLLKHMRELPPSERRAFVDAYDGEIAYTDQIVGGFLEFLDERGFLENSIVVIFSDHAEEFWEHGGVWHRYTMYNEVQHVPLIIRTPKGPRGVRVNAPVSLTDMFATIMELANLEPGTAVQSQSLVPYFSNPSGTPGQADRTILGALYRGPGDVEVEPIEGIIWTATRGGLKLISSELRTGTNSNYIRSRELYDLQKDPGEQNNISSTRTEDATALYEAAMAEYDRYEQRPVPLGEAEQVAPELSEEEREELKALGYL